MKNNKGFSLVELIIVIAIMAILAGALAPALIKYINKSRKSTDISNAQTIATAVTTALSVEKAYDDAVGGASYTAATQFNAPSSSDKFIAEVSDALSGKALTAKYKSGENFVVTLDSDKKSFTIKIGTSEVYPGVEGDYAD